MFPRLSAYRAFLLKERRRYFAAHNENWYFDYQRVEDFAHLKWVKLVGDHCVSKFIPIRRQLLQNAISQDERLLSKADDEQFYSAAQGLDSILTDHYKEHLKKLKSIYNPLSVDRETVQMKSFSKMELMRREEKFLDRLSGLLDDAHFYKLPQDVMEHALDKNNVGERVVKSVSVDHYDTLCFWVVGMDIAPIDLRPWYIKAGERARVLQRKNRVVLDPLRPRNYASIVLKALARIRFKLFGKEISRIERFKRVVVAYRIKDDMKLHLKSFKDIPCENLEFLLPLGKIKICFTDKVQIALTWVAVTMIVYASTVSNLIELKFQPEMIAAVALSALVLRSWSAYNNMRTKCLCNISQALYFGAIATNYALLTLISDRAEDEVYKASLLILAILHCGDDLTKDEPMLRSMLTSSEIKDSAGKWLKSTFHVDVDFTVEPALSLMVKEQLLVCETRNGQERFGIASLKSIAALQRRSSIYHPANSLDIEGSRGGAFSDTELLDDEWADRPFEWR